jgi:hypothetical protein
LCSRQKYIHKRHAIILISGNLGTQKYNRRASPP